MINMILVVIVMYKHMLNMILVVIVTHTLMLSMTLVVIVTYTNLPSKIPDFRVQTHACYDCHIKTHA